MLASVLVYGLVRPWSANLKVMVVQMLAIPIAGFWFFFLQPEPPVDSPLLYTPAVLIPVALVLALVSRRQMSEIASGKPVSHRDFVRQGMVALAARLCLILAVTGYLFVYEPWFAVANVVANVLWAAVWIPKTWRQASAELGVEIEAPPEAVWSFLSDVGNWPAYQVGVISASSSPPGRLQIGSRITVHRKLAVQRPVGTQFEANLTLVFEVTDMVATRSYSTMGGQGSSRSTTSIEPIGTGTRLTIQSRFRNSVVDGYMGTALQRRWAMSEYRRTTQQSLDRLRQVLEAA